MKLHEIAAPQSQKIMPNGLQVGQVYVYNPKPAEMVNGKRVSLLTTYSFKDGHSGEKNYSIEPVRPIAMKILKYDHQEDDRILRVRIMSDPEQIVKRFSVARKDYTKNADGEIIERRIKTLPEFENLDGMSDEEFQSKFGRARLEEDHGLVGYVYIENQLAADEQQKHTNVDDGFSGGVEATGADEDDTDKLSRAIAIYRANHHKPRKQVIKIMMTHLNMTYAGASSYYTKAMHAVEEERGVLPRQ